MKRTETRRRGTLLAVDPSLTVSGWAHFEIASGALLSCGVVSPPPSKHPLHYRLKVLQAGVETLMETLELDRRDVLVSEGPAPLVKNPLSSLKVEQVRSIFEAVGRSRGLVVPGRINPRSVHTELLGLRGRQLGRAEVKSAARTAAMQLYGRSFEHGCDESCGGCGHIPQDVIDALLVGSLALSRLNFARGAQSKLYDVFDEKKRATRSSAGRSKAASRWSSEDVARAEKAGR
ncbi:MAG: hypothetical protein IT290_06720 [Deltaproteobacteria bacterium]|nr:hypothetical protein [Deltaproteobacteria bacterium]